MSSDIWDKITPVEEGLRGMNDPHRAVWTNIQETVLTIPFNTKFEIWPVVLLIPATLIAVSCTRSAASADPQRPPDVELVPVQQKDFPVYREWIGTVDGM